MLARRTKRLILGFGFLAFLVVVIIFSVARFFENREEKRRYEEERAAIKPREQLTVAVQKMSRETAQEYAAEIAPWIAAQVAAEVPGRVIEARANVGEEIKKGDVIVRLDPVMGELELRSAEAALENARVQLSEAERLGREAEALGARKVISQTELEAAKSKSATASGDVKRLEAEGARLETQLARHEIKAPFDGIIRARLVEVGDAVGVNQAVAELDQLDPLRVIFYASDTEIGAFDEGVKLELSIAGKPGKKFEPRIENIARSADPQTRLFKIEASLPNPEEKLPGGTQGVVTVSTGEHTERLFLPASAVRLVGAKAMVEKVADREEPQMVEIEIGAEVDGFYPVLSGLKEGDRVVVR